MWILRAGLAYFALVFAAGFAMGSVRVPFLVPRLGVRLSELLEMPFMLVAIVLAARFVVRHLAPRAGGTALIMVGVVALAVTVVAELSFAWVLQDLTPTAYLASRDPVSGNVYLAMLLLFAAMPLLLSRRRRSPAGEDVGR